MQITLDLSLITVPTPEPYLKNEPDRQRENLAYVGLQLLAQAKQQGVKVTYTDVDEGDTIGLQLDGTAQATRDLQWQNQTFDLGPLKIIVSNRIMGVVNT